MNSPASRSRSVARESDRQAAPSFFRGSRLVHVLGIGLLVLAVLLAVYGAVAYVAWQRGQTIRAERARKALHEELANQMAFAREDIDAGNFTLALRRLEWILERDDTYPGASELRQQAQNSLDARLMPTPIPTVTPTPIVEETPTVTSGSSEAIGELEQLVRERRWEEAITAVSAFQAAFPEIRRQETDKLLYDAYLGLGLSLLPGDQVELGLFYLAQAEKLGDLPVEAGDQRSWAELYLLGIGYYGVDWGTTVFYFRGLCAAAPFYQDSCDTLHEALVAYGDQFAAAQDWCPARELYAEATELEFARAVGEKLQEAASFCLEATATPTATAADLEPALETTPTEPGA